MMRRFFPISWQSGVEQKDSAIECTDRDEVEIVHHGGPEAAIVTEDIQPERKNSNPRKSKGSHSFKTKFQKFSHKHRPNKSKDEVKVDFFFSIFNFHFSICEIKLCFIGFR